MIKETAIKVNTVIDGEYLNEDVTVSTDGLFVGKMVLSAGSCEGYELLSEDKPEEKKKEMKANALKAAGAVLFPPAAAVLVPSLYKEYAKHGIPVRILWRNGLTSTLLINKMMLKRIQKVLF